ncbi:hypothetical protein WICPIJ_000374 [Wickerhamomyces pijperi]|uniref:Uncharacterized protein n=1 Tax=Wickerhamomyces pijperi TaxID=599730 RepID=A0A9P8TS43_WICPI|nr:hypothetical protein WICPIJ_000374 [Wickerhamomyces pijperi]
MKITSVQIPAPVHSRISRLLRTSKLSPLAFFSKEVSVILATISLWGVWVGFNTNDHTNFVWRHVFWDPVWNWLQWQGIHIGVSTTSCEKNQITEEIHLQDDRRQRLVGLDDLRDGNIEIVDQCMGSVIVEQFVDETRVLEGPL